MNNENTNELDDWKKGYDSQTKPDRRVELMNDWLKQNKQEIIISTQQGIIETEPIGFIDKLNQWG